VLVSSAGDSFRFGEVNSGVCGELSPSVCVPAEISSCAFFSAGGVPALSVAPIFFTAGCTTGASSSLLSSLTLATNKNVSSGSLFFSVSIGGGVVDVVVTTSSSSGCPVVPFAVTEVTSEGLSAGDVLAGDEWLSLVSVGCLDERSDVSSSGVGGLLESSSS